MPTVLTILVALVLWVLLVHLIAKLMRVGSDADDELERQAAEGPAYTGGIWMRHPPGCGRPPERPLEALDGDGEQIGGRRPPLRLVS